MANFGDWQFPIYLGGLSGVRPELPMTYAEWARRAEQAMSPELWSYVAGGAGDERTQDANVEAFRRWALWPRMLVGAAERDPSVELFGRRLPSPLLLSPVGVVGLCDLAERHGDLRAAEAATAVGVPFVGSTLMQDPLEDVAAAVGDGLGWFQLYPPKNRDLTASLVHRAEAAGYAAIVVTVDTLVLGWRPRDLTIASFPQLQGLCLANYTSDPVFRSLLPDDEPQTATGMWAALFGDPTLSWDDLGWIRSLTSLPLLVKGICHPEDVRRALDLGVDGIWCSTHGGRQANGGLPALVALPEVVAAAGGAPVVFDSGVRSGVDVLTALALGATAVGIGRPYAHALAVGGRAGVEHLLHCLLAEMDLTMAVDGYPTVAHLTPESLRDLRA